MDQQDDEAVDVIAQRDSALARLHAIETSTFWRATGFLRRTVDRSYWLGSLARRLRGGPIVRSGSSARCHFIAVPSRPTSPGSTAVVPRVSAASDLGSVARSAPQPGSDQNALEKSSTELWNARYALDGGMSAGAAARTRTTPDPIHYTLHPFLYRHAVSKPLTGSLDQWWLVDVGDRYLRPGAPRVLSIGCGTAIVEETLLSQGYAGHITAYETAPAAIEAARLRVAGTPLAEHLDLRVGNVLDDELPDGSFDLVFVAAAIHHFVQIDKMFELMHRVLSPNGLLIFDEYVGPDHHQHPDELYGLIDEINDCLDPSFRVDYWTGKTRTAIKRPSVAEMLAHDPSEGVHSSRILPLTYQYFDVIERRGFGGAVLRSLFSGILDNFDFANGRDQTVARLIILIEQLLVRFDAIPHHNAIVIARPRTQPRQALAPFQAARTGYESWTPPE